MAYAKSNGLFEFYQPNKHKTGDCVIRALTKALNKSWLEVFDDLVPIARKQMRDLAETEVVDEYLIGKGFKWVAIRPKGGEIRPTVISMAYQCKKEVYVVRVSNHVVCVRDGKYHDIWNCGNCSVYGYWVK